MPPGKDKKMNEWIDALLWEGLMHGMRTAFSLISRSLRQMPAQRIPRIEISTRQLGIGSHREYGSLFQSEFIRTDSGYPDLPGIDDWINTKSPESGGLFHGFSPH